MKKFWQRKTEHEKCLEHIMHCKECMKKWAEYREYQKYERVAQKHPEKYIT